MAARRRDRDEPEAPPQYDAYFGMIVLSLIATFTALVFLWLDYSSYPAKPPNIQKATTSLGSGQ
jgi:hypothetical protein